MNPATTVLVTLLLACSAPSASRGPSRYDSRILSGADLRHPVATNAYDLLRIRRPQFLRFGGPAGVDARVVYIDGMRAGRIEDLKLVSTSIVNEIRLLSAPEASFRYGLDHPAGAIVVTTRIGPYGSCAACR
jgi:hypothetical protein